MRNFLAIILFNVQLISIFCQTPKEFYSIMQEINADSLKKTVVEMQNFSSRFCLHNNKQVAQYIVDRLHQYGIENAHIDSFYVDHKYSSYVGYYSAWMYNAIGTLKGSEINDSSIIIGAHLDAVTYNSDRIPFSYTVGANDNASGIAVMLEMARIFHKFQLSAQKNIDFMAFDGEEVGLKGASYDAQNRKNRNEPVILMMNNDMVGYQPCEKEWKIMFIEYPNSQDITPISEKVCKNFTSLSPVSVDSWDIYSDSYYYYFRGFKCFYAYEFYDDPHYHSSEDKFEYLNFDYMKEVAKLNFAFLYHFSIGNVFTYDTTTICSYNTPLSNIHMYPNPASNTTEIQFILDQTSDINITFFDIMGKPVLQIPNQTYSSGKHEINIDCRKFEAGIYFCTLETQQNKKTIKLLIN